MQLTNKVFAVTGAGNGIGRQVSLELLRHGARVVGLDLRKESLQETAQLTGNSPFFTGHTVDVSDRDNVRELTSTLTGQQGGIDGVFNVAGIIQPFGPFASLADGDVDRVLAVNLGGVLNVSRALLPHLLERPESCLVNVASMGGVVPVPGQAIYGASKAAVKLLSEGIRAEYRGTGLLVVSVIPGAIDTEITRNSGLGDPFTLGSPKLDRLVSRVFMTSSRSAARTIVRAVRHDRHDVSVGLDARLVRAFARLAPQSAVRTLSIAGAVTGGAHAKSRP